MKLEKELNAEARKISGQAVANVIEAMKKAEEAQSVASERQRYREVYIIPPRGIGPYPMHVITPPRGY